MWFSWACGSLKLPLGQLHLPLRLPLEFKSSWMIALGGSLDCSPWEVQGASMQTQPVGQSVLS